MSCVAISCDNLDESCIGETDWSLKSRFMQHRRPSSVNSEVSKHVTCNQPDHSISLDNVRIQEVEPKWFDRRVMEAIQIWINNLILNKDSGRYNLPAVWNNTLRALGRREGGTRSQDHQASVVDSQCPSATDMIWWFV